MNAFQSGQTKIENLKKKKTPIRLELENIAWKNQEPTTDVLLRIQSQIIINLTSKTLSNPKADAEIVSEFGIYLI